MNITKSNYPFLIDKIKSLLSKCNFISIDLEMTGTKTFEKELTNTTEDPIQWRFFKLTNQTKPFFPIQLGICGVNLKQEKLYPFSFYIQPSSSDNYTINIDSIRFLTKNSFDFNMMFYEGIIYYPVNSNKPTELKSSFTFTEEKDISPENALFSYSSTMKLKEYVNNYIDNIENNINNDLKTLDINISYIPLNYIENFLKNISKNVNSILKEHDLTLVIKKVKLDSTTNILKIEITSITNLKKQLKTTATIKNIKKLRNWLYYQSLYICGYNNNKELLDFWKSIIIKSYLSSFINDKNKINKLINLCEVFDITEVELKRILDESSLEGFNTDKIYNLIELVMTCELNENSNDLNDIPTFASNFKIMNNKKYNISELLLFISKLKKPLVFHNGALDLMHITDKFFDKLYYQTDVNKGYNYLLYSNYNNFKNSVNSLFPVIFDTKYICENSLVLKSYLKDNTSLENITETINNNHSIENDINLHIDNLKKELYYGNNNNNNDDIFYNHLFKESNISSHNAGFDSFYTAKAFMLIINFILNNFEDKDLYTKYINKINNLSNEDIEEILQVFKNKIMLSNSYNELDFNTDTTEKMKEKDNNEIITNEINEYINEIFIIEGINKPVSSLTLKKELIKNLELTSNISIKQIYDNNLLLLLVKDSKEINFLKEKIKEHIKNNINEDNNFKLSNSYYKFNIINTEVKLFSYLDFINNIQNKVYLNRNIYNDSLEDNKLI